MGWIAVVVALVLCLPGSASAAQTFGSDLEDDIDSTGLPGRTFALRSVDPADQALGGPTAPTDGVITSWRVKASSVGSMRFRAFRGSRSLHQGPVVDTTSAAIRVYEFPTRVTVQAGDAIGLDVAGNDAIDFQASGGTYSFWSPFLAPAEERAPDANAAGQLLVNASLEPDADGDGFGDETQDGCPADPATSGACPDAVAPVAEIDKGPRNKQRKPTVRFTFSADDPAATFECRLKGKGLDEAVRQFTACASPRKYRRLDEGKFRFQVRAIDATGNVGPPARDRFKILG